MYDVELRTYDSFKRSFCGSLRVQRFPTKRAAVEDLEKRGYRRSGDDARKSSLPDNMSKSVYGFEELASIKKCTEKRVNVTQDEIDHIIKEHEKWLRGENGSRAVFNDMFLEGVDFSDALLNRAFFQRTFLIGAKFDRACVGSVLFTEANVSGASFKGAYLKGASFRGANADRANFEGSEMRWTSLNGGSFVKASFLRASLYDASVNEANLSLADFRMTAMGGVNFENAIFQRMDDWK